ncbi:lipase member K-like [Octopus sinensis]|uniref:Lipase member K-like n=1 Tax=Octopus sinensis TaxID=2607531 RepID=A0A6P7TY31_9MOLL|nr:lipase member K-like [Octopus sinensis]
MQRINGKNISRPVFIQHGVLSSSVDWLIGRIACVLADSGFDVWLGNVRGNIYSRAHSTLSPDEDEFWNFSFEDHAAFDIPAMVSFVLTSTNKDQLVYIGHSQGSLIGLIQLSRNQEFADKVALMIALAPTLSFQGVYCPFLSLAPYHRHFYVYSYLFQPSSTSVKNMVHYSQVISSGQLRHYDYDQDNMRFYNQVFNFCHSRPHPHSTMYPISTHPL